jgi:hypothetical protein
MSSSPTSSIDTSLVKRMPRSSRFAVAEDRRRRRGRAQDRAACRHHHAGGLGERLARERTASRGGRSPRARP